jgi:hypothetical protein
MIWYYFNIKSTICLIDPPTKIFLYILAAIVKFLGCRDKKTTRRSGRVDVTKELPLLEEIFREWQDTIGADYQGYRNHVYRMIHFCLALCMCNSEQRQKIIIAAAFHDIGIWIGDTVDYIPPSLPPMRLYLQANDLAHWSEEITLMITEHHKIRPYRDKKYPLVEVFRRGDLVDFSFGLFRFGIAKSFIRTVQTEFPNHGFHRALAKRAGKWFLQHPFNPAPMMKW